MDYSFTGLVEGFFHLSFSLEEYNRSNKQIVKFDTIVCTLLKHATENITPRLAWLVVCCLVPVSMLS